MTLSPELQERPDVLATQRGSNELVKRIRKLRWIGMDEEARALQDAVSRLPPANPVLGAAPDTD